MNEEIRRRLDLYSLNLFPGRAEQRVLDVGMGAGPNLKHLAAAVQQERQEVSIIVPCTFVLKYQISLAPHQCLFWPSFTADRALSSL